MDRIVNKRAESIRRRQWFVWMDGAAAVTMHSLRLSAPSFRIDRAENTGGEAMIRLEFDGIDSGVSVQRRLN